MITIMIKLIRIIITMMIVRIIITIIMKCS